VLAWVLHTIVWSQRLRRGALCTTDCGRSAEMPSRTELSNFVTMVMTAFSGEVTHLAAPDPAAWKVLSRMWYFLTVVLCHR
jgi:hypothetical protein